MLINPKKNMFLESEGRKRINDWKEYTTFSLYQSKEIKKL